MEKLPELRGSRCSTRASFVASSSFTALSVHRPQRGDLLGLLTDEHEQLLARHRLRLKHSKIKLRPGCPLRDQHAKIERFGWTSGRVMPRASDPHQSPRRQEQPR